MSRPDVVVIGGGVIGLSIAWQASLAGLAVAVVDPDPGSGSSNVAAGMLAPVTEARWGEEELLELGLASSRAWPHFAAALEETTGLDVGYRDCGTLVVAVDGGDMGTIEDLHEFKRHLGLNVELVSPSRCRELEPLLAPGLRGGLLAAEDHQVDNRPLVAALVAACEKHSVELVASRAVAVTTAAAGERDVRVTGVDLDSSVHLAAGTVVLAAGWRSAEIAGIRATALPPVRPVKGQILRMRGDEALLPSRTVRGLVAGSSIYLVPRAKGHFVVGATVEELGADTTVTAGAVYGLLRDAQRVLPAVAELELLEASAGLRPGTPDNSPLIGPAGPEGPDGLLLATGHYRNGVLLAPETATVVVAMLTGGEVPARALAFSPARFAAATSR
jgi:glycine oxidase